MIKIVDVHKHFNSNYVLRGVNLEVHAGETLTIIGGSGSGKTVLLRHIVGLFLAEKGIVEVDGVNLGGVEEHELHEVQKKIGFLFQDGALFDSLSAGENVAFGLRHQGLSENLLRRKVSECLDRVGLSGIEDVRPSELSGGMKKRVALARAIARDPKYMLYDEPTTGLDPIFSDVINDLMLYLQKSLKMTSIIVTHDLKSVYKVSSRVAMLFEGRIIATGTPDEIKNTSDPYVQQFISGSSKGPIKLKLKEY
ncbi:MAG: ABC transporter ATP-binding protein [Elusimicrobia bacterium]|nr:ABC transporter ATP-binding protein [Elusimicrobiota bacterium]MBU2615028.1 ABC transporter ATP-binding protein [Elusimicrobiota bacterium]